MKKLKEIGIGKLKIQKRNIVFVIIALLILLVAYIYVESLFFQTTDDAYVESHLVQIAPKVSGQVVEVLIDDNQRVNEGDTVIVPAPFFAEYRHYVNNYGGTLIEVPVKEDFGIDIEAIKAALTDKTAAVLINSPNNPSGKVYTEADIIALSKALNEHAANCGRKPYLICDEPYRAITYDGIKVSPVYPHYDSSIVLTSFAKNLSLPGERIGYIAVNPACPDKDEVVAASIFTLRTLGFVNAPAFFQRVVAESWNAEADYTLYKTRRDELMSVLDEAGIKYASPEGAFYMWCKVPECFDGDDMDFCDYLKKYLILGAPGTGFGGKGWFRLAYCVDEKSIINSRKAFIKAMNDLKK